MDDLISRQAAIDLCDTIIERDKSGGNVVVEAIKAWKHCVSGLPSAQPELKKGTWMTVENPNYSPFDCSSGKISVCSVCGYAREQYDFNYCPHCGADMREENINDQTT